MKLTCSRVVHRAVAVLLYLAGSRKCPGILNNVVSRPGLEPVESRQQVVYLRTSRAEGLETQP